MYTTDAGRTNTNFKKHQKFREPSPFEMKKDSVVSNALQKQLGYDGETESFMLPVLVGNEMLLTSTGNP